MDYIILKYLQNDLSEPERARLMDWLEDDDSNRETLRKLELYWKEYGKDNEEARNEVRERVIENITHTQVRTYSSTANYITKVAAVFLFVIGALFVLVSTEKMSIPPVASAKVFIEKVSEPGQILTTKLEDGTVVKLRGKSKLLVPSTFDSTSRKVEFIGEAFFEVAHDSSKPFIISTDQMDVTVLGTSFIVKTSQQESSDFIAVESGKVRVEYNETMVLLEKGQMSQIIGDKLSISSIKDAELLFGWINKELIIRNLSFKESCREIEKWFGVVIEVDEWDEINQQDFNATFQNPTLKEVLNALTKIFKVEYEINRQNIKIYRSN